MRNASYSSLVSYAMADPSPLDVATLDFKIMGTSISSTLVGAGNACIFHSCSSGPAVTVDPSRFNVRVMLNDSDSCGVSSVPSLATALVCVLFDNVAVVIESLSSLEIVADTVPPTDAVCPTHSSSASPQVTLASFHVRIACVTELGVDRISIVRRILL